MVYKSQLHSYRDLPLRVGEFRTHRHELSAGALHGLFCVRCFTQDDAYIFHDARLWSRMRLKAWPSSSTMCTRLGFGHHIMELSTMPEDHIGTDEQWRSRPTVFVSALNELGKPYVINLV